MYIFMEVKPELFSMVKDVYYVLSSKQPKALDYTS